MINHLVELLFLKELKGMGNATINKDYANIISFKNDPEEFFSFMLKNSKKYSRFELELAMENAKRSINYLEGLKDTKVITIFDDMYPKKLASLGNKKPVVLYLRGNIDLLNSDSIAVVGTREPSEHTKNMEEQFVKRLVTYHNVTVVSGLALGCDKIAHEVTLNNNGYTIAVLPGGFNKITPKSNKELAERILSNKGLLMTEYAPDSDVSKYTYVERDAVIAAMSNGTLVMQCGVKSGTMHTVDAAYKMKRRIACYAGLINADIFDGNKEMINSKDSSGIESETDLEEFVKKALSGSSGDGQFVQMTLF